MELEVLRAEEEWQRAGADSVKGFGLGYKLIGFIEDKMRDARL